MVILNLNKSHARISTENGIDSKVVMLTSYDTAEYRDAAFHSKADHYIPKDSFMRLVDLIRADAHISDGSR